jgi:hypothetical protein
MSHLKTARLSTYLIIKNEVDKKMTINNGTSTIKKEEEEERKLTTFIQ